MILMTGRLGQKEMRNALTLSRRGICAPIYLNINHMAVIPIQELQSEPVQAQPGFISQLLRNRKFSIGFSIFLLLALVAIIGGLVVDPALRATGSFLPRQPPGPEAWLGTD